jgi:hypothetical protein
MHRLHDISYALIRTAYDHTATMTNSNRELINTATKESQHRNTKTYRNVM